MWCCPNCFINQELRSTVEGISFDVGNCDYCGSENVKLIDAREIAEQLQPVVSLYEVSSYGLNTIAALLQYEWGLFSLKEDKVKNLLEDIFLDVKSINPDLFNSPVVNISIDHQKTKGIISQWESLKSEIIVRNRFFLENVIDLESLEKHLCDKEKIYKAGELFYRGRISTKEGLQLAEIGKPPVNKATSGRANPKGIPYLYISTDLDTTLYETRATYLDYVTVGTFRLTSDIKVVKLIGIDDLNPFEVDLLEKVLYQPFLKRLEIELSKPLRRFDTELDYLPTQYLCEFIKHIGFDGVAYGSAMKKRGVNIAIFDDTKIECIETKVIEIKDISIIY
jgi:hypothetical protein